MNKRFAYLEGYEVIVFEDGEIYSKVGKRIATNINEVGYENVSLTRKETRGTVGVHRLVAMAFLNNPLSKTDVNHKDGNKLNNHASNLEWMTRKENMHHAFETGLIKSNGRKPWTQERDKRLLEDFGKGLHIKELANKYKISEQRVRQIVTGTKTYKYKRKFEKIA